MIIYLYIFSYLIGSIPFSIYITKLFLGVDVRNAGSGHATTTNTIRQAGWIPGIIVFIFDIAKGYIPVTIGLINKFSYIEISLIVAFAILGHCWPIFANFKGGMGLATFGGGILAISGKLFVVALILLLLLTLLIKHSAKASVYFGFMFPVFTWFIFNDIFFTTVSIAGGLIISYRFTSDWNRKYKELWLDREI